MSKDSKPPLEYLKELLNKLELDPLTDVPVKEVPEDVKNDKKYKPEKQVGITRKEVEAAKVYLKKSRVCFFVTKS